MGRRDRLRPAAPFVLAWNPSREQEQPQTEVEVTFTDAGEGKTLVELEHRGWERLGEHAAEARESYAGGWNGVLEGYAAKASE